MRAIRNSALSGMLAVEFVATAPATAQQIYGTPGSPSATMTIQGDQIPPPPQKFGGKIERNDAQSKPYWPRARRAAEGRAERAADHDRRCRVSARRAPSAA